MSKQLFGFYITCISILILLSDCSTLKNIGILKNKHQVEIYVATYVNPVNISVMIDKNIVVDKDFSKPAAEPFQDGQIYRALVGPVYEKFIVSLSGGVHRFTVDSKNGNAGLDVSFTIDKPLWLVLSYLGQNHFQLNIFEHPVVFN